MKADERKIKQQQKYIDSLNDKISSLKEKEKQLIEVYDEYIEFLGKELSKHEVMSIVRPHMAASKEVIEKGVELRKKISNLKNQVDG